MKKAYRNNFLIVAFAFLIVVALAAGYEICRSIELASYASASEDRSHLGLDTMPSIEQDGQKYIYNTNIRNIVLLGIDKDGKLDKQTMYQQAGQSDVILLLSINQKAKSFFVLPVNRDTMTDVLTYGPFGDEMGTSIQQISLAYGYGDGGLTSGNNTLQSLKNMLCNIPLKGYLACPTDTVGMVNDAVGGVTVKVEDDFSEYDSSLVKGQTVTLKGEQALHFVRGRMLVSDGTNLNRMHRQEQFYNGLLAQVDQMSVSDLTDLYDQVIEISKCSMGNSELCNILTLLPDYTFEGFYQIDGTCKMGAKFNEFYPDEAALKALLIRLYFTKE